PQRKQFANPIIKMLGAYADPAGEGRVNVTCQDATAIRLAASNTSMPTDATARAATVHVLDATGQLVGFDTGVVVAPLQHLYVKAFAYESGDGTGSESPPQSVDYFFASRPRLLPFDDGKYALKASDPVGKETNDDLFVASTKTVKVGTVASPASLSKTLRISHAQCVPQTNGDAWTIGTYARPTMLNVPVNLNYAIVLPKGVTITAVRWRGYRQTVNDTATATFQWIDDTGTATTLATLTHAATGRATVWASISQVVGSEAYICIVALLGKAAANEARGNWPELAYT